MGKIKLLPATRLLTVIVPTIVPTTSVSGLIGVALLGIFSVLLTVRRLNSYTEYSPSGRGLHIWVYGNIPKALAPSKYDGTNRVEMYDCERGFTVTGNHYKGTPTTIEDREEILLTIHSEITVRRQEAKAKQEKPRAAPLPKITQTNGDTLYGQKALKDERAILVSTPEGGRNAQLNRSAYSLGQLVAGHELSRSSVERELSSAAARVALDDREIESTLRSGIDAGMQSPRSAPAPQPQTATNGNGNALQDKQTARGEDTSPFYLTDLGNAERFKAKHGHKVRWCETWNKWGVFNGKCWEVDRSGQVDQLAKATVRAIYKEAATEENDEQRKKIVKHATASESNRAIRAMLDRAKSELPITPEEFNRHIHLINCNNGTLDLKTGELRPHEAKDFLTRCIKINYNPLAPCNEWEQFLCTIFAGDCDLITFIHQALGMSLSGDTSEQCLFICHGNGSNGKTTMLEAVRIIMAGYGLAANIETFQVRKYETVRNDIAEMYGARLVTASENTMGSRLNEAFIKKATGKEPLRARRLHEDERVKTSNKDLLERYEAWCEENGEHFHVKDLKRALNERGYHSHRSTGGLWVYHGVGLLAKSVVCENSDGSDGSDTKNSIISRDTQTLQKSLDLRSLPSLPSSSEHKNGGNSDGTFTKGNRDERGFLVICTIEGCTRLNTNGGNAMCDEHWQAHK